VSGRSLGFVSGSFSSSGLHTTPVNQQSSQDDVDFFYQIEGDSSTSTTLRPDLSESSEFGLEVTLGRALADLYSGESNTRVAINKYANDDTNLATQ
jgi:hypothetical protein